MPPAGPAPGPPPVPPEVQKLQVNSPRKVSHPVPPEDLLVPIKVSLVSFTLYLYLALSTLDALIISPSAA